MFANPPVFAGGQNVVQRLGNVAPYLPNIRDRHLIMEDMSIQKMFKMTESANFELRGTFLNPFNRHGIGGLVTNITDPNFGQYTGQHSWASKYRDRPAAQLLDLTYQRESGERAAVRSPLPFQCRRHPTPPAAPNTSTEHASPRKSPPTPRQPASSPRLRMCVRTVNRSS